MCTIHHIPTQLNALSMARIAIRGPVPLTQAEILECCAQLDRGDLHDQTVAHGVRTALTLDVPAYRQADGEIQRASTPLPFPQPAPAQCTIRLRHAVAVTVLLTIAWCVIPKAFAEAARVGNPNCNPVACWMPIEDLPE